MCICLVLLFVRFHCEYNLFGDDRENMHAFGCRMRNCGCFCCLFFSCCCGHFHTVSLQLSSCVYYGLNWPVNNRLHIYHESFNLFIIERLCLLEPNQAFQSLFEKCCPRCQPDMRINDTCLAKTQFDQTVLLASMLCEVKTKATSNAGAYEDHSIRGNLATWWPPRFSSPGANFTVGVLTCRLPPPAAAAPPRATPATRPATTTNLPPVASHAATIGILPATNRSQATSATT